MRIGGTAAPSPVRADARPRAPWSARAEALASQAVAEAGRRGAKGEAAIAAALKVLLASPEAVGARVSVCVRELSGSRPPAASQAPDLALNPASNSKLATATFALGVLGPDHRFETAARLDGAGNLYLVGGFDPSLRYDSLLQIARALRAQGLTRVAGEVVLDNTRLVGTRVPRHFEEFGDEDWDYLARPEALSLDRNLLELTVTPAAAGQPAKVVASQGAFEVRSRITTSVAGAKFKVGCDEWDRDGELVRNARGQAVVEVWGDIAADYAKGKKLLMKSPDPVASFADRWRAALREAGIEVAGRVREGGTPPLARTLHVHRSAPLAALVRESVATSNAFDHEMYALAAAAKLSKDGRTSIGGAMDALGRFLSGLGLSDFRMENASGIGDANRLSGNDMVDLLRNARARPRYGCLLEALARPGRAGTLRSRMLGTPAESRLHAKTGTLKNSVALSGFIERGRREPLAFSALINDYRQGRAGARAFVDALGIAVSALG